MKLHVHTLLKNQEGFALIVVLSILVLVTGLALVSFSTADTDRQISSNNLSTTRAYYAAEAGAVKAMVRLSDSANWRSGYSNRVIGNCHFSVQVIDSSTNPALKDSLILLSTGNAIGSPNGTESKLEVLLAARKLNRFRYAVFGDTLVYYNGNAKFDAYNSDSAAYVPNGMGADLGGNDMIYFNGDIDIYGNVGTPDTIIESGDIDVSGTTNNNAPGSSPDSITAAEMAYAVTNSNAPAGLTLTGGASYNSTTKTLTANGGTITLSPGIYYFSNIDLQSGARFIVPASGNVVVYTTGNVNVAGGYLQNQTSKAEHLLIYSTGAQVNIAPDQNVYAAIHAPNAAIFINSNTNIYGSAVGKSFYMNGNGGVHYDRALNKLAYPLKGRYKAVAWKVL